MTAVLGDWPAEVPPDQAAWHFLLRQCREHHWQRRQRLASFSTPDDWAQHCRTVRARFREAVGPLPERTPLEARLTGVLEREGYVVEKLLITTQPGLHVTANLYRPSAARVPAPAILNPVGHWTHSKAEEVVQARCIGLARQGYVALVYDPLGQGERSQFWDTAHAANPLPLGTSQHSALAAPLLVAGRTLIAAMLWDGLRLLDYLETRPEVDAGRIGCTGASGGGTYTMFLTAYDERIKAAVPVCAISSYERMLAQGQIGEPCQNPAASYRDSLDMADLLMCAAPASVQIVAATYDTFPLIGAREAALDVRSCYTALGIPERTALVEIAAGHDYNKPMREAMYSWFNRWLGDPDADPHEPPYRAEPPENLWCTSTGQVSTVPGAETVLSLNRARAAREAAPTPTPRTAAEATAHQAGVRAAVAAVLGFTATPAYGPATLLARHAEGEIAVEHVVFESEAQLPLPCLLFVPPGRGPHPTVLFLHDHGMATEAGPEGLLPALARAGYLVAGVDLRGWGETTWQHSWLGQHDNLDLLGSDAMLAHASYLWGTWLITQRVLDTIRAVDMLCRRPDADAARIGIAGCGLGGLVACHAAVLNSRIAALAAYQMPVTYRHVVEAGQCVYPASAFPPGALPRYDLPHLAGALAPRQVLLAALRDAAGLPLPMQNVTEAYAHARQMHDLLGGATSLLLAGDLTRDALAAALLDWAARLATPGAQAS